MVKSAGSDRSGTYGTCRGGRSSLLGGKGREQEKARQKREEQMLRDYPEIVSKMVLLLGAGLGMRKVLERIAVDYRKIWRLAGRNVLLMKRLYLPARRWKTVFPSRKRTSAWECVWEPERIVPLLFC